MTVNLVPGGAVSRVSVWGAWRGRQRASGVIAIGQEATGVIAIGQLALGVVAVGQSARWPTWRRAAGVAGLTALTALWWFAAGQPLVAALA